MFSRRSERPAKPASWPSAPAVASAGSGGFTLYITPVLYLYMESAQKYLAEHPIRRVLFWRRDCYGVPSATPTTHS
jgi:hypothetical protein